jgi:stearoyl-CoA desaturase (delta-9 desaturase)
MEWVFATMGTVNLQQGPIWWCSIHRLHHKHSDTEQDPHNSRKGFLYAHLSWLFYLDPRYVLLGKRPGQLTNVNDLTSDPYYRWLDRHYYAPFLIYLIMLGLVGGWFWFFWGGLIPIIYNNHVTYSVNSLSHLFGYRSFKTYPLSDQSKNNFLVGILALGEGWHNNHHAFPNSARHGFFKWWEFDFTYVVVWLLNKLGLVSQVNLPSKGKVQMQNIILL